MGRLHQDLDLRRDSGLFERRGADDEPRPDPRAKTDKAALELLNTHFYQFADQDVLNITCKGRTRALGNQWNSGRACGCHPAPNITHLVSIAKFWEAPQWQQVKVEHEEFKRAQN